MKFIYQYDTNSTKIEVTLPKDTTLTEALEAFESFLRAAGYHFDGVIDVIEQESENVTTENTVA